MTDVLDRVPQTYGEAVELYPWLRTALAGGHEWDNRTTAENAEWLATTIADRLRASIVEYNPTAACWKAGIGAACQCQLCDTYRLRRLALFLVQRMRDWQTAYEAKAHVEQSFRREWWLSHGRATGCDFIAVYGDDGEMSCGQCLIDFRRMSATEIAAAIKNHVLLNKRPTPAGQGVSSEDNNDARR